MRAVGITDGNMDEGSLRCDANVSVRKHAKDPLGTRVEIKNLNSFRSVHAAINYQIAEQSERLAAGVEVIQATALWDVVRERTQVMRTKEDAQGLSLFSRTRFA